MTGNKLALKHGAMAKGLLTEDEFEVYDLVKAESKEAYGLDDVADEMLLHQLAFHSAKLVCAYKGGAATDTISHHENAIARVQSQLNIRRDKRTDTSNKQQTLQAYLKGIIAARQATGILPPPRQELPAIIDVQDEPQKKPTLLEAKDENER